MRALGVRRLEKRERLLTFPERIANQRQLEAGHVAASRQVVQLRE